MFNFLSFLKSAKAKISSVFVAVFGKDAAQKFADGAVGLLKTAAGVIAIDAVQLIATSNPLATPAEKRDLAFTKIGADAKAQGITLASSLINLLIELAVQRVVTNNIIPVSA